MQAIENEELLLVDGGNFWDGFFCGAGIVLIIGELAGSAVTAGMSDVAIGMTVAGTAKACSSL